MCNTYCFDIASMHAVPTLKFVVQMFQFVVQMFQFVDVPFMIACYENHICCLKEIYF